MKRVGIGYSQLLKILELKKAVTENPKFTNHFGIVNRTNSIDKPYRRVRQISRIESARKLMTSGTDSSSTLYDLKKGDMRDKGKEIPDNSIDIDIYRSPVSTAFESVNNHPEPCKIL